MKKSYIIIISSILAIITGIAIGVIIDNNQTDNSMQLQEPKLAEDRNELSNEIQIVSTSSSEEKTTPNTLLIFNTYHKQCEHTTTERKEIPVELVNKTKREFQETYEDWHLQEFSAAEVSLLKEIPGICNEHYVIRDNNGYVYVYLQDANEKETLYQITEIVSSYLPQTDQIALKKGIKVVGKEKLNATLEDYE